MQAGELKEAVRNRSVYRQLHLGTAGGQKRCHEESTGLSVSSAGPLPGYTDMPWRQVTAAANSLAADRAGGRFVSIQGCIPTVYEEAGLREDMGQFAAEVKRNGMEVCDVNIQVPDQVNAPQYFVTAVGYGGQRSVVHPGQELVVTRQIALAGTAALARTCEAELYRRFPFWLVDRAKGFDGWMSVVDAAQTAYRLGAAAVYNVAQGGIFNALWEMAERADVGLEAELRAIPVKQETIEICEYFDLNPYYLYSEGCLLIGTEQADNLIAGLGEAGIPASVIGRVTEGNDRIIRNGENRRFLDRPKRDEWWKAGLHFTSVGTVTRKQETGERTL